ncbi:DMT family transporter [Treponema primitia]|uniref:DMT family transporter n=1 Tax=Treponema primitia TaxID=88058 RepID=UPI00025553F6|nr:DMT family transporter [Treponema primitia]
MTQNVKGQLTIAACAFFWSTAGLFIKIINWHPMVIAGIRSLFAALFMIAAGRMGRRKRWGKAPRPAFFGAALSYAATMILFVAANKLTSSANAILLQYSAPVWAALFGWILAKEKPQTGHWIALGAVLVGLLLFFREGLAGGSFLGDCLAVLAGISIGLYSVLMRMQREGNPADALILSHWFTVIACIPFLFIAPPAPTAGNILAILFLGIVQNGAAGLLFAYGIRRVRAVQAMLIAVVEPVMNPVWVLIVTGEKPGVFTLIGGGIIVTAVILSSITVKEGNAKT